jgi:hypothetical protein
MMNCEQIVIILFCPQVFSSMKRGFPSEKGNELDYCKLSQFDIPGNGGVAYEEMVKNDPALRSVIEGIFGDDCGERMLTEGAPPLRYAVGRPPLAVQGKEECEICDNNTPPSECMPAVEESLEILLNPPLDENPTDMCALTQKSDSKEQTDILREHAYSVRSRALPKKSRAKRFLKGNIKKPRSIKKLI